MITFSCPNGHTLTTADHRAGSAAKCPKCQMPVVVPLASAGAAGSSAASAPGGSRSAAGSGIGRRPPEDVIVFLCPNGHKLNGPARMKGMAGQCPHCGVKFRIPDDDDDEEDELARLADLNHVADSMSDEEFDAEGVTGSDIRKITAYQDANGLGLAGELEPFEAGPPSIADAFANAADDQGHPLAAAVARLWQAKEAGQQVDLHLAGGEVYTLELFAESLSQGACGAFARRDAAGGYALSMIPWESIVRVEIRGIKQLPPGRFQ